MKPLPALYAVSALAGVAAGLFNPLLSALMVDHGQPALAVGLAQSVFFLFVILASPLARHAVRRHGARNAIAAGLALTALAALALPLVHTLGAWIVARAAMGVGLALYMVAGQTSLNALAADTQRGVSSALHALAFGVGLGVGPLLGAPLYTLSPLAAFGAGASLLVLGVPLALGALPPLRLGSAAPRYALARGLVAPLYAVFAYGVAEATLLTMFPVVLMQRGQGVAEVGYATAAFVGGGLLSALPLSHLSDRVGREPVLAGLALAGALAAATLVQATNPLSVALLSFVAGASLGPVYAIALALTGQRLAAADLPGGCALFTVAFSLGSMLAPGLSALVVQFAGAPHVFTLAALLFATLAAGLAGTGAAWRELRAPRIVP